MSDDMLSQDEINNLLKRVAEEENGGGPAEEDLPALDSIEKDALGEIGNISFGSAATALSTLLNQKVEITTPEISVIDSSELNEEFPVPHVAVNVDYTAGFEGTNLLVINSTDAAIIADLMMGNDGTSPEAVLSEMYLSAMQEAMNQMMGSASTSMSTIFNKKVDISPPGIEVMDVGNEEGTSHIPKDKKLVKIAFHMKIGTLVDSYLMQIVTIPFAKKMVEELMGTPEEELSADEHIVEEPVPPAPPMQEKTNASVSESKEQPAASRVENAAFSPFEEMDRGTSDPKNLDMLLDISLEVTVELGRTKKSIKDILHFSQGSIIELDKLAGEPVDILVNQKLVARGEVVVIDENFGVRVTDIASREDRIRHIQ
ncbi:flagellar motor switch phosphatase FliY [Sinobaca sp. H24]|uniref:flagellar motor switch phosphatase FliY n=1 Tax=Sinobaca sp. H24 TaxID=2923376 RepID=UPI002079A628|nr:flagellar motor switch phosphatase FliY [Sinobaca sp. H24]